MKVVYKRKERPIGSFFSMVLTVGLVAFGIAIIAATSKQEEKKYKVELTVQEWSIVLEVIDKSTAPHTTVISASKAIIDQVQPLLQAEQKRVQDSINKAKPKQ
jgi:uncharacterized membrane protein